MGMTKVRETEWEFVTPCGHENVSIEIVAEADGLAIGHEKITWAELDQVRGAGWQPIEAAPKDGTWVLLSGGSTCVDSDEAFGEPPCVVGRWLTKAEGYCGGDDDGWQFACYDSGYYGVYRNPKAWMSLPPNAGLSGRGP